MKEFNPKVSIVIPVYNGSNYLRQAIDSALTQTYENIEIIVVNDGSKDKGATEKIAKSYGDKIRYFKKENGGVADALNFGIEKMTGEYFSWLSHDDMYCPDKIKYQIKFLNSISSRSIIIACNAKILHSDGNIEETYIDKQLFKYFNIFLSIDAQTGLNGCSLLIPKEAFAKIGRFDIKLPVTQDYDLWFRLNKQYEFVLLEKNLVISRRHELQDSVKKQEMCFEASDKMHYDFLKDITFEQFNNCIKDNGINKIINQYKIYKSAGYVKTASMILKYILKYYRLYKNNGYTNNFISEIGHIVINDGVYEEKNKKRLLFYTNVWNRGGVERVLSNIFNNLSERYDFILVTNNERKLKKNGYRLPKSVSHIRINNQNISQELTNLISLFDVDLFVGNPNFIESFIGVYSIIKDMGIESIAYNHGYYFLPYMYDFLHPVALKIKNAYSKATAVIWLSQVGCNIYNIENNNGIYLPNPSLINPKTESKIVISKNILAVGRFDDEIKRIDKVLLVFKEILKIDPDYKLNIVGNCPLNLKLKNYGGKTLRKFIDEINIPVSKIRFYGEQRNVTKFYKKSSFLIMTSTCEGFPMVLMEALSFGLPCACLEYLGIEEIIDSGNNGWLSSQDGYNDMAIKITSTINNKVKYNKMSQNALKSIKKYNIKSFCDKWEYLIESFTGIEKDYSLQKLKPTNELGIDNYKNILLEYEKDLNLIIERYNTVSGVEENPICLNRINEPINLVFDGRQDIGDLKSVEDKFISLQENIESIYETIKLKSGHKAIDVIYEKLLGADIEITENNIETLVDKINKKSKKKRLLFCSGHWLTGGVERVLVNLFEQLSVRYDIFLITPFSSQESRILIPEDITHIIISDSTYINNFDTIALSWSLLLKIDIVIGLNNLFEKQLDFYNLCEVAKIKTIASNHEYFFYPYTNHYYRKTVAKRLNILKHVDAVLWLTNFSAAVYGMDSDNGYLMANPNTFEMQNNINEKDQKIILCVGRFNDYIKRIDRILTCFRMVLDKEPEVKLMLVGSCNRDAVIKPGDTVTVNDLIDQLNISDKSIIFVGEVNDIKKYYAQASLILLTSTNEGFPMVLNEAAYFGVPIVCNKIPGLEDLVINGENGYITDQDDIESMANFVCKILSNDKLRNTLGNNARKLAERFDAKNIGDKWKFLIDTLLQHNPKEELRKKLNEQLSYNITDYYEFSKTLTSELNDIFEKNINNIDDIAINTDCQNCKMLYNTHSWKMTRPVRLIKDGLVYLRRFGLPITTKKVTEKIYWKILNIIKR